MHRIIPILILAGLMVGIGITPSSAQPYQQLRGVIHLDSTVSGGEFSPEELIRFLVQNELEVAIFTDHATTRVRYGFFPARHLMETISGWVMGKLFDRESSVFTFGPAEYLATLMDLNRRYSEIIVLPGVEVYPFYYWAGNLLNLEMVNGHKHFLAFGMDAPDDYANIPTVSEGFFRGYSLQTLLSLWPLALIFLGFKCRQQSRMVVHRMLLLVPAWIFFGVGALFLLHNYPYQFGKYDAYHGDQGVRPYQDFIDYVIGRGGMVFWAHPEASKETPYAIGPVTVTLSTEAPYKDLLYTRNYTGFAAFYEGMKYIIPPGAIWDQILTRYCTGKRSEPIWAIAEGDVEGDSFSPKLSQTVFMLKEKTREDVLQSLREGRIYAMAGPLAEHLSLADITLSSERDTVRMGSTLQTDAGNTVHLNALLECEESAHGNSLKADLIYDGEIVQTYKGEGRLEITYSDSARADGRRHYFRLDVRAPKQTRLLTNPIFLSGS